MLSVNEKEFMFEQKFRPSTLEECILPEEDRELFAGIIKKGKIPHLILHSTSPGTGKTTIAKVLCNETNAEMMFVNGSDCKIDFVRGPLTAFASAASISGRQKVIVIDEFDRSGLAESQRHMRSFMEAYSSNCSIVITANSLDGIIKPLQSRCRVINFGKPAESDIKSMQIAMIKRCLAICEHEGIAVEDKKVIAALVKKNFPEFRKTVNTLDQYSTKGVIDAGILSYIIKDRGSIEEIISALKGQNVKELRALAPKYSADYSWFVEKLSSELYTMVTGPSIIRMYEILGENNQYSGMAASLELHIMYMLIQLVVEMKWK